MDSKKDQSFSVRLRCAIAGLIICFRTERSLRTQCFALLAVAVCLCILRPGPLWWALIAICSAVVLALELLNTAVERLADHLHPNLHPQIRIVKDCAAAAVLLVVVGAIGVAAALAVDLLWR
jgi:undecaprenol kinase